MADGSKIEWTDATWNPIRARLLSDPSRLGWYCVHASEGCRNRYAETMNRRGIGTGLPYKPGHRKDVEIFINDKQLKDPLRWKRPRKIFVCSMTDLFADFVPDEMIDQVFAIMALCPQHTFQILTKRADRMREYQTALMDGRRRVLSAMSDLGASNTPANSAALWGMTAREPLPNVWLGVSVEDQDAANSRIPDLLQTPAAIRWLSCEPLLGAVEIDCPAVEWMDFPEGHGIQGDRLIFDWIVVGGESGPHARPMHPDWARSLRDQCASAGIPFLFKQWGEHVHLSERQVTLQAYSIVVDNQLKRYRHFGSADGLDIIYRVGKKAAGRLLDGVEHNGFPVSPKRIIA